MVVLNILTTDSGNGVNTYCGRKHFSPLAPIWHFCQTKSILEGCIVHGLPDNSSGGGS